MSAVKAERYAAYKDSGVEWLREVPGNWRTLRLKDVIEKLESGVSVNASDEPATGNNIGVLKTSCVGKDSFIPDENKSVWPTELNRVSTPVRAGRIIVSRMNTPQLVGASAYVPKNYPNIFLPDRLWQTVFFSSVRLDSKWLSLLIGCKDFRYLLSTVATGTSPSMKNLGQDKFLSISIPFPSHAEQTAIATYLDTKTAQIDRQIDLLSQKATQYGKLKRSLINETVTRGLDKSVPMKDSGVEWIGEVPENWDIRRIKEIFIESKSKSLKGNEDLLSVSEYTGVTLKQDNVGEDEFLTNAASLIGYKLCKIGDLVINIMLAWKRGLGVSAYYGIASPSYAVYTPQKEINSSFFHYRLRNEDAIAEFKRNSTGIIESRLRLYSDSFYALSIAVPPLDEQTAIAAYLDEKSEKIDRIIDTINTQIYKLKDLRKALINDVVTGKIKVGSEGQTI